MTSSTEIMAWVWAFGLGLGALASSLVISVFLDFWYLCNIYLNRLKISFIWMA